MPLFNHVLESINILPFGRRTLRSWLYACTTKKAKSHFIASVGGVRLALDLNQHLDNEYLQGKYDAKELDFLFGAYEPGGAFVDIGANQGFYSLMLANKFPDCKVISFEPDPYSIQKFKENIVLNKAENIVLIPKGLSDRIEKKTLMINTSTNRAGNSMVCSQTQYTGKLQDEVIEVQCVTLNDALSEFGINKISALKIDVEGYEYPILNQFFKEAPASLYPRVIILEAFGHAIPLVGGSSIELLVKNGYSLANHIEYNYFFALRQ